MVHSPLVSLPSTLYISPFWKQNLTRYKQILCKVGKVIVVPDYCHGNIQLCQRTHAAGYDALEDQSLRFVFTGMAEPKMVSSWLAAAKAAPSKSPGPSSPEHASMVSQSCFLML